MISAVCRDLLPSSDKTFSALVSCLQEEEERKGRGRFNDQNISAFQGDDSAKRMLSSQKKLLQDALKLCKIQMDVRTNLNLH